MLIASFAGAGLAALVAAGTAPAATAPEAKLQSPLLAPWSGPYGGVPPFEKVKVEHFQPALEAAMAEAARRDRQGRERPRPAHLREHDRGAGALRPRPRPREQRLRDLQLDHEHAGFQAVEEAMAPRLAAFSDQITQNEKLFKRIAAVYDAREKGTLTAGAEAPGLARLHQLRARGREARRDGQEAHVRDQPAPGLALHELQPERARGRDRLRPLPGQGGRPRRPARLPALGRRRRRGAARPQGQVGHHQHALEHGAVPHLLRPARPAREGLADVLQPRRQRRRERQQRRSSPRS